MSAKFVICIDNKDYPLDLTVHKVYKVISTEKEEQSGWVRIVDDSGEDYLHPARRFLPVQLSEEVEQTFELIEASHV